MQKTTIRHRIEELLSLADVRINGNRPWDIQVHNEQLYARVVAEGSLGLGESYRDGWWEADQLDEFFTHILRAALEQHFRPWKDTLSYIKAKFINLQSRSRAFQIGRRHYNIGNDLFEFMLGKYKLYSCGYWKDASCLDESQEAKMNLICRKLHLKEGMQVLDIGCGWGESARFLAERYRVEVTGVTVSENQVHYGTEYCRGYPVKILYQDYRDLSGKYDRILSIGMFEHVGYKNYRSFMRKIRELLKKDGLFLLHTIGNMKSKTSTDPWIDKYIFPNSLIPSAAQITRAADGLLVIEDWHNFGTDYDKTLMAWYDNFKNHWHLLQSRYGESFYRIWTYYLLSCAGSFRARKNHLFQIVFSPEGVQGGYEISR